MKYRIFLSTCILLISTITTSLYANINRIECTYDDFIILLQKSIREIKRTELLVLNMHDLTERSSRGSYSADQRDEMNIEFQPMLNMIDPSINRSSFKGLNMLNSEGNIITVNTYNNTFEYKCVDITQKGLELDRVFSLENSQSAFVAFEATEAALHQIKKIKLSFIKDLNKLSRYSFWVKSDYTTELLSAIEIFEDCVKNIGKIKEALKRTEDLIQASSSGTYSQDQLEIMNAEFHQMISEVNRFICVINNQLDIQGPEEIFIVDNGRDYLEFTEFCLTPEKLNLDHSLNIDNLQASEIAQSRISNAMKILEQPQLQLVNHLNKLYDHLIPIQNNPPIARAGKDNTIYADFRGSAKTYLFGTSSYDRDNDPLTYHWNWIINNNNISLDGIYHEIELPVGEHEISLIVNDGLRDSEPDYCIINVIEAVKSNSIIFPGSLNAIRNRKLAYCLFKLPQGYGIDNIDKSLPLMIHVGEKQIQTDRDYYLTDNSILSVYNTNDLLNIISTDNNLRITFTAKLKSGQMIYSKNQIMTYTLRNF